MNFLKAGALGMRSDTMGVRPEHIALSRDMGQIAGTVSHVEKLGGETLVYVNTPAQGLLTIRLFGEHDYAVDETAFLTPDQARAFHFDAAGLRMR
jgi:multiple sugar transport system ATP-binding protein